MGTRVLRCVEVSGVCGEGKGREQGLFVHGIVDYPELEGIPEDQLWNPGRSCRLCKELCPGGLCGQG